MRILRVSVESLQDELVNDMRNGIYEAMEACEEIDFSALMRNCVRCQTRNCIRCIVKPNC